MQRVTPALLPHRVLQRIVRSRRGRAPRGGAVVLALAALAFGPVAAGAATAPSNTAPPTIPTMIGYLPNTGTAGTWAGDTATYAYQWEVSASGLSGGANGDGTGATTLTYSPVRAEVGGYVRLKVVATNAGGSATAYSTVRVVTRPDFVYSANASATAGTTAINGYAVTPATGALVPATQYSSLTGAPRKISLTPRGNAAYVTGVSGGSQVIYQFAVNAAGELTPLSPATVSAPAQLERVYVTPDGRYAYATALGNSVNRVYQYAVAANGALTPLATPSVATGVEPTSMDISSNGLFAYITNRNSGLTGSVSQYAIGANGQLTPLTPATVNMPAGSDDPIGISLTPDDRFAYVGSYQYDKINAFSVAAGGQLTWISGSSQTQDEVYDLSVSGDGTRVFYTTWNQARIGQYTINPSTGLLSTPVSVSAGQRTADITVSADGRSLYAGTTSTAFFAQATTAGSTIAMLSPALVATGQPGPQTQVYVQVKPETIAFAPTATTITAAASTITYRLAFQQSVTGLDASDFQITGTALGWQVTSVTGEGAGPYDVTLGGPGGDGTVVLALIANRLTGANGLIGPQFNETAATVTVDRTPPTATWGATPASPTAAATVAFPLTFGESVTGIAAGDFTNAGTATGCTFTPSAASGSSITVTGSGCSDGTVTPVLAAGAVADAVGNAGPTTAVTGGTVVIDRTPPAVTAFTATSATPANAGPVTFSLTLSQAVTGLAAGDLAITGTSTGWSVGSITGSDAGPYTITLTAGSPGDGTLGLRLTASSVTGVLGVAGPTAPADAAAGIVIDTSVPGSAPTITSGPSGPTNQTTAAFTFTGAVGAETYQCRRDGGAWAACTSPTSYDGLAEGAYQFEVRIVSSAGTPGPAAARSWVVDLTAPPAPPVYGTPASPTSSNAANLTFTLSEPTSTAQCMTDGVNWTACTSPLALTGLQDGTVTVKVREVDAAGNVSPPTTVQWNVDTTPPSNPPVITGAPVGITPSRLLDAAITSDPGNTLECRLDGGVWAACTSPFTASGLADGGHLLEARQVDAAGNRGPSASVAWTVDTTPPGPPSLGTLPPEITDTTPTMSFTGDPGNTFQCRLRPPEPGTWTTCTSPFTASPALGLGTYDFDVRQVDPAGNVSEPASMRFSVVAPVPTLPPIEIGNVPAAITNAATASLTLSGAVSGATIKCSVDGGAFATCTSPLALSGLADGQHTVTAYQELGSDFSTQTTVVWTVDRTGPGAPGISPSPAAPTNQTSADLGMSLPAGAVSLECRFSPTPGSWGPCTSPQSFAPLADGSYTFETRGVDAVGNRGAIASVSWTVNTTPPSGAPVVTDGPAAETDATTANFAFTYGPGGASAECSLDGAAWVPCVSPLSYPGLAPGEHTLRLRTVDAAGNVGAAITTWRWRVTGPAPAPAATPAAAPRIGAAKIGRTRTGDDGVLRVPVSCDAPAGTRCTIRLRLGTGRDAISVTVAVTAGTPTTARLRLNRAWQRRVAKAGELPETLRTTTTVGSEVVDGRRRVTLVAPQGTRAVKVAGIGPNAVATVGATCEGAPIERCRGVAELIADDGGTRALVVVGRIAIAMASGTRAQVRIPLNATGRDLAADCRPLLVRARVIVAGRTATSAPFTMRLSSECGPSVVTG